MSNVSKWNSNVFGLCCIVLFLSVTHLWGGCRPTPPLQEATTEKTSSHHEQSIDSKDASPIDQPAPPEPSKPEPSQPDPVIKDEGPVVPEKVLINGLSVTIVHVTDGDTLYVVKKPGGWASRIRLKGLDTPECFKGTSGAFKSCDRDDDYFGLDAYKITKKLGLGEFRKAKVYCKEKKGECEKDAFGRYLGYIELPNGRDLAKEVVLAGGAWSFTSFSAKKMATYCRAEADAIRNKKGMWARGRAYVKTRMSSRTKSWYYKKKNGHDTVCSREMKESFSKRAGE